MSKSDCDDDQNSSMSTSLENEQNIYFETSPPLSQTINVIKYIVLKNACRRTEEWMQQQKVNNCNAL